MVQNLVEVSVDTCFLASPLVDAVPAFSDHCIDILNKVEQVRINLPVSCLSFYLDCSAASTNLLNGKRGPKNPPSFALSVTWHLTSVMW